MTRIVVLLVLGIGLPRAESMSAPGTVETRATDRNQQQIVTLAQVEEWLRLWQARLNLNHWRIDVRIVRAGELNPDTLGHLRWNASDHTALIKVLNPLDYELPPDRIPQDIERTVIHELVHLQLSSLPRNGSKVVEEQVVNDITEALLQLDHVANYAMRNAGGEPSSKARAGTASRSK